MKRLLSLFLLLALSSAVVSPVRAQMIGIIKLGAKYEYGGRIVKQKDVEAILSYNRASAEELQKFKSKSGTAGFFGGLGGFMIGYPLGTAAAGGEANWALAGAGLVLAIPGMMIQSSANKHLENAINIYNGNRVSYRTDISVFFAMNRVEVFYRF
jgi:hypothetical protein